MPSKTLPSIQEKKSRTGKATFTKNDDLKMFYEVENAFEISLRPEKWDFNGNAKKT